jgi:hypothetical protein
MNIFLEELRKTRKKLWLEYSVSRLKSQSFDLITMRPHTTFAKILGNALVTVICCVYCASQSLLK